MSSISAEERARRIKLIIFDVDGVLTDGTVWVFPTPVAGPAPPSPAHAPFVEPKGFSAHDGAGISLARRGGLKCGLITRRESDTVAIRARSLKMDYVYQGQTYKMRAIHEILAKESITLEEIAYVGDDVIDLPVMRVCGLAIAVANAREQCKSAAHYITPNRGGYGAGRDAIEFILAAQGVLDRVIEEYIVE
jgi:3-deoxy-D-manno-octulosonate 8-phosphate phosphatase (KDO 8-P phosphatase)